MTSKTYSVKKKTATPSFGGDSSGVRKASSAQTVRLKHYNRFSTKKKEKKVKEEGASTGHTASQKQSNRPTINIKMKKMDSSGSRKNSNRLSANIKKKKKKPPGDRAETEFKLGRGIFWTSLESAAMLDISTWSLENQAPLIPEYLPDAFLRRLWLLSPEARSVCCQPPDGPADAPGEEMDSEPGHDPNCAVHPLDLVTAVYMSANHFLQQEMTVRMVQCQFAVPLILPALVPEQSCFLLWPLRAVVSQWKPHPLARTKRVLEGDLATTEMPMVSCVKLGHCKVSKSRVLSRVIGGPGPHNETFVHRGMDGGQLDHKLSNGLVELGWSLPSGDPDRDVFPVPVAISNLRGDAAAYEKCLDLLCRASSVLVVFCGIVGEKEKRLLASWKGMASKLILVDISDPVDEVTTRRAAEFLPLTLGEQMGLPSGAVLSGAGLSEEELADGLRRTLNDLLPDRLTRVTLQAAANIAMQVGMCLDEGAVCRKARHAAEAVLKGLEHGSAKFRESQLPLQGALWSRLAELDKEEGRQIRSGVGVAMQLRLEKRGIVHALSGYKMTAAMKVFTDALFTTDKIERTFFLNWMKLRLRARQMGQCTLQKQTHDRQEESARPSQETGEVPGDIAYRMHYRETVCENGNLDSAQDVEPGVVEEEVITPGSESEQSEQGLEVEPALGLEHFLREMGLIFELTHTSRGSASCKVLRLPGLAVDLLLYGIPLELMDGDASNIPSSWIGHVLAELRRRLPPVGIKVRVLTNLGVHCARNAEVFSALLGVDFPRGQRRLTRGLYMLPLWLPDEFRMEMDCDFLIMVDVEGLCSPGLDQKGDTLVHDNEMATVATGLSDVLIHNITSDDSAGFETNQTVIINALLRTEVCGHTPICELLTQDKGLNAKLQSFELGCVDEILQTETGETEKPLVMGGSSIPCLRGPWQNTSLSEPVDKEYSKTVIELKRKLFEALTKCASKSEATGLPEFMGRLLAIWEAVKAESFLIDLQNTEVATAFRMLCTELSLWESIFLEHMESWFAGATKRVIFNNAIVSETGVAVDLLSALKEEARVEVKTDVDQIRSKLEAYLMKDDFHKDHIATYRPNLMSNMNTLQDHMTEKMMEKLEATRENHNSSVRLRGFQSFLENEQEVKLHALAETSKVTNVYPEERLEEEFEGMWNNALSNFDFNLPRIDDIPARVTEVLRQNLISRGLQKHMRKLKDVGKNNTAGFTVHEEHFDLHCKLKHIRRQKWLQAHYVVNYIIEEYKTFVAEKSNLAADVSDGYVTKVLEKVEDILRRNPLENTTNFEVDLKVFLCSFARQDFQEIHKRYTKDSLLPLIEGSKNNSLARFIYQARRRDQCERVACGFTSMVLRPMALDYIYMPMGQRIVDEMVCRDDTQQYRSPQAFNHSLLKDLMEEDSFESFLEYLLSYESFGLGRIQKWVAAHLSEMSVLEEWTRQGLEEVVGRMKAAASRTVEDVHGVLSDTKVLLEKVCLNLEKDGDVSIRRDFLESPLFSITVEWDRFVACLLEALEEMRLALAKEFTRHVDVAQLLQALPVKPQECLFNGVRGCGNKCPLCGAPCEVEEADHKVHRALLHRPERTLSDACCDSSPSQNGCPDWDISHEEPDGHTSNAYWRYVLARFKGRFDEEYRCGPSQLPEGWSLITQEEALQSLNRA